MYPIQQLCATLNNRLWKKKITKMIKEYNSLLILQKAGWCVCSLVFKEKAKIPICFNIPACYLNVTHLHVTCMLLTKVSIQEIYTWLIGQELFSLCEIKLATTILFSVVLGHGIYLMVKWCENLSWKPIAHT